MSVDPATAARKRSHQGLALGLFATGATLVVLGLLLFGNELLDTLSDGRRAATLNLSIWVIIVSAIGAIGNAIAGRRGHGSLTAAGIILGILPFVLLAQHVAVHGPRHPAPSYLQALRDRGAELTKQPGFAPTQNSVRTLSPDEAWCVVEGPTTNSIPTLFSPNLRPALSSLGDLKGPIFQSLDANHPLEGNWLVAVYPGGSARLIDASTTDWKGILPTLHKNRALRHPE